MFNPTTTIARFPLALPTQRGQLHWAWFPLGDYKLIPRARYCAGSNSEIYRKKFQGSLLKWANSSSLISFLVIGCFRYSSVTNYFRGEQSSLRTSSPDRAPSVGVSRNGLISNCISFRPWLLTTIQFTVYKTIYSPNTFLITDSPSSHQSRKYQVRIL